MACNKSYKSSLIKISCGSVYLEGKTWSSQLDDKVEPVATHFHWAIRNCEENPEKLQALLSNIVQHYKNNHNSCHSTSSCRKDPNYEISRKVFDLNIFYCNIKQWDWTNVQKLRSFSPYTNNLYIDI